MEEASVTGSEGCMAVRWQLGGKGIEAEETSCTQAQIHEMKLHWGEQDLVSVVYELSEVDGVEDVGQKDPG